MPTIKDLAQQILTEKQTKVIPENIKEEVKIFNVTGILEEGTDTSDATATVDDIMYDTTAYIAIGKVTGGIIPENGYIGPYLDDTNITLNENYVLDIQPETGACVYQSTTAPNTSIMIGEINNNSLVPKMTITLDELKSAVSTTQTLSDIHSAAFSKQPIKDNVYNLMVSCSCAHFDDRVYYNIRIDLDTYTLYEGLDYSTYLKAEVDDDWGGHPNMKYSLAANPQDASMFIACPLEPRTQGYVQGIQFIHKLVVGNSAITSSSVSNLTNPSNNLRNVVFSNDGQYFLVNLLSSCEGLYRVSDLSRVGTLAAPGYFITVDDTTYVLSNNNIYNLSLTKVGTLTVDFSYKYACSVNDKLLLFSNSQINIYDIDSDFSCDLLCDGVAVMGESTTLNIIRMMQKPRISVGEQIHIFSGNQGSTLIDTQYYPDGLNGILKLTRKGMQYINKNAASSISAREVLQDKKFISSKGIQVGTMPNNGELEYTPTTSTQNIPSGYTSGGIINPAVMEEEDYDTCIDLVDTLLYGGEPPLPYVELEYIQGTGTQWIDTDYTYKNNTKFVLVMQNKTDGACLLHAGSSFNSNGNTISVSGNTLFWSYNGDTRIVESLASGTIYTIEAEQAKVKVNGEVKSSSSTIKTSGFGYKIRLFNSRDTNRISSYQLIRFTVYEGGTLVRDYIPVKRKLDNVICLYDTVSTQFFTNDGTGAFIAGPEKGVDE